MRLAHTTSAEDEVLTACEDAEACAAVAERLDGVITKMEKRHAAEIEDLKDGNAELQRQLSEWESEGGAV